MLPGKRKEKETKRKEHTIVAGELLNLRVWLTPYISARRTTPTALQLPHINGSSFHCARERGKTTL
jgi:hypothetical protein